MFNLTVIVRREITLLPPFLPRLKRKIVLVYTHNVIMAQQQTKEFETTKSPLYVASLSQPFCFLSNTIIIHSLGTD